MWINRNAYGISKESARGSMNLATLGVSQNHPARIPASVMIRYDTPRSSSLRSIFSPLLLAMKHMQAVASRIVAASIIWETGAHRSVCAEDSVSTELKRNRLDSLSETFDENERTTAGRCQCQVWQRQQLGAFVLASQPWRTMQRREARGQVEGRQRRHSAPQRP